MQMITLILLTFLFWLIPMIMILVGAIQLRKHPAKAKKRIIIAGIWLLIGFGFCGGMFLGGY